MQGGQTSHPINAAPSQMWARSAEEYPRMILALPGNHKVVPLVWGWTQETQKGPKKISSLGNTTKGLAASCSSQSQELHADEPRSLPVPTHNPQKQNAPLGKRNLIFSAHSPAGRSQGRRMLHCSQVKCERGGTSTAALQCCKAGGGCNDPRRAGEL